MTLAGRLAADAALLAMLMQRAGARGIKPADLSGLLDDLVSAAAEAGDTEMRDASLRKHDVPVAGQRFGPVNDERPQVLATPTASLTAEPLRKAQSAMPVIPRQTWAVQPIGLAQVSPHRPSMAGG